MKQPRWWLGPMFLLLLGLGTVSAGLAVQPGVGDEWSYFRGERLGGPCEFRAQSGRPCPTCGMTRSWVRAARGQVLPAVRFHAAGAVLFYGLAFGGVLGAVRLYRRDPQAFRVPPRVAIGLVLSWVLLQIVQWIIRLFGGLPLP